MTSTFGEEFIKDWPNRSPIWSDYGIHLMKLCERELKPVPLSREEILENSSSFSLKVGSRIQKLVIDIFLTNFIDYSSQ